jgi:hypothetical protein
MRAMAQLIALNIMKNVKTHHLFNGINHFEWKKGLGFLLILLPCERYARGGSQYSAFLALSVFLYICRCVGVTSIQK